MLASPFINYCDYDMAGAILAHIYGALNPRVDPIDSHVVEVNQSDHVPKGFTAASASMADTAFAYVPTKCKTSPDSCRIHVVYHGCASMFGSVQDAIYFHTGYNNW